MKHLVPLLAPVIALSATPVRAAPDITVLIGACEAAVAASAVAPLQRVTPMRLEGMTWLGEVEGITVVFSPMTHSTCSLLAWSDAGRTLVSWSEVEPLVAAWAEGREPGSGGTFSRATCDGDGIPLVTEVGPDRGGYAGIGELSPPAIRVEVWAIDPEACADVD